MTTQTETFQIPPEAAEMYEQMFVPAIFAEWAPRLVSFAGVAAGQSVLDVACGTGIVSRSAVDAVGPTGSVVGVDLNQAMLDVAARIRPDLTWKKGDAGALPFPDDSFDVVLCQMALMFFPDRVASLREMARVSRGPVAIVVPSALPDQPAYGPFVSMATDIAGPEAASLLGTYWSCGRPDDLRSWFDAAGLPEPTIEARFGTAHFGSIEQFVATEVEGSPLIQRIDEQTYARIREGAAAVLDGFTTADGKLEAPFEAQLVRAG